MWARISRALLRGPGLAPGAVLRPAPLPAPLPLPDWALRARRVASATRTRLSARRLDLVIVVALLTVAGTVHGINMGASPGFFDDEGTYVSQAWAVTHLGELAPYTYWYDHPPLGWLIMAGWSALTGVVLHGGATIATARALMLVLTLVSASLVYVIARRLAFSRPYAALAVALFSLSPLAVHYQRMVLLDNIGIAWLLGAFALVLSPRRRLGAFAAAGVCLAAAVLCKETLLLTAPAVLVLAWQHARGANRAFALGLLVTAFVLPAVLYPLFATLRGELLAGAGHTSLAQGLEFQLSRPGGGGLANPHSGTRQLLATWLHDDPLLITAGVLLAPVALAVARLRAVAIAIALPVAVAARPSAYVPAMFVLGLLPFAALLVAGLAQRIPWRPVGVLATVAAVGIAAPSWIRADVRQMRDDDAAPARAAVAWLDHHADHRSTVVVDNTIWLDLVERGFSRARTIWFYKLDLDPAVPIPRDRIDYVVRSNLMEGNARDLPRTRDLLDHSRTVAAFSSGTERFEIRRITSAPDPVVPAR